MHRMKITTVGISVTTNTHTIDSIHKRNIIPSRPSYNENEYINNTKVTDTRTHNNTMSNNDGTQPRKERDEVVKIRKIDLESRSKSKEQ